MQNKSSLVFTGDIGFDRYMYGKWDDEQLISPEVLSFLHSADHVVANVEGPVAPVEQNTTTGGVQQLLHTIDPEAVTVLNKMQADIWNICNNHIMDAGEFGIKSTLDIARENGVLTIGAGMNIDQARSAVILDEAGGIGMFGVGYQRACRKADENTPGCYSWSDLGMRLRANAVGASLLLMQVRSLLRCPHPTQGKGITNILKWVLILLFPIILTCR